MSQVLYLGGINIVSAPDDQVLGPSHHVQAAVFVDPARVGLGIGKRLLAALEQLARRRGIVRLHLFASLNAVPFYRAAGYVALREEAYAHPSGISLASVAMEKVLAAA